MDAPNGTSLLSSLCSFPPSRLLAALPQIYRLLFISTPITQVPGTPSLVWTGARASLNGPWASTSPHGHPLPMQPPEEAFKGVNHILSFSRSSPSVISLIRIKLKTVTTACVLQCDLTYQIAPRNLPLPPHAPLFPLLKHAKLRVWSLAVPSAWNIISCPSGLNSNVSPSK